MHIVRPFRMPGIVLVLLAYFGIGCGGAAKTSTNVTGSSIRSVDGLLKSVENLQTSGSLSTALVQFAFLYPDVAPADRAAKRRAMLEIADWKRVGNKLVFVSATVEEGLPMPLSSLTNPLKDDSLRANLAQSKSVLLVRYLGPTLPDSAHLTSFLRLSAAAAGQFAYAVDLSTRRLVGREQLLTWNEKPTTMFAEQVVPGIERGPKGTITFFTRGMAKFGLPDLEQTDVSPSTARQGFASFQALLSKALDKKLLKVGDVFQGHRLSHCKRSTIAIERDCVNLTAVKDEREN